ncbi:hypothetical protein JQK88_31825 [Mesorhizobium caraganae]|uniref:hypothetical protein n=1 Tax=Mesorhizobium caraganae TaxID=483206 RepID=UPI00193A96E5|nr:hypothetical protein [Mesorhizobium caraganae]MBM2715707.1 hypothetical protein [Mesorhizobium caraganae]
MSRAKVSAFDCDILRSAIQRAIIEGEILEKQSREHAAQMIRDFTGDDQVDLDMLDWIVRK